MMPLSMADYGEKKTIVRITGQEETKHHLENLGFVEGADVTVVSKLGGNLIVKIKNSSVAISRAVANKIMV
ncbi:MAG: ferrous iron transport protein A [Clostridiales bacterium]|nr:ferrous iron transport protein A [Clostridiales bacterium]